MVLCVGVGVGVGVGVFSSRSPKSVLSLEGAFGEKGFLSLSYLALLYIYIYLAP